MAPKPADFLVTLRRDLHRHPELRFEERRTAGVLAEILADCGYRVIAGVAETGLLATRDGQRSGPHVVLRADMDALPISDAKQLAYASSVPGVAHACGHDVHMAVAVGVGQALAASPPSAGTVTILFQPAEETPFGAPSGARAIMSTEAFQALKADYVLGLHCWPSLPAGTVGIDSRIAMAAKDAYRVRVTGVAAHAASPEKGRDAVHALAQMVTTIHQAVPRAVSPGSKAIVHVGTISGGRSQSIVAERAELTGTIRTVDSDSRRRLKEAVGRVVTGTATAMGVTAAIDWANEMPAVLNDSTLVQRAIGVAHRCLGVDSVVLLDELPMTSDDFALYGELMPALYVKLGVAGDGAQPPLHSSSFDVDESSIQVGVRLLSALIRNLLEQPAEVADTAALDPPMADAVAKS